MKNVLRSITVATAMALVVSLVPTEAKAVRLVSRGIQWLNGGGPQGAKIDRQNLAVGVNDTTDVFSTDGWALPNFIPSVSATVTDSLVIGWIVITTDSADAYTPSATGATITIEGSSGGAGNVNFHAAPAITFTDPTTTDKAWRIPIFINPTLARGANAASPGLGYVFPVMRMRLVAIGGTFSSARVSLVYFQD